MFKNFKQSRKTNKPLQVIAEDTSRAFIRTQVSNIGIEKLELNESTNSSNIEKVKQQLRAYVFINYKTLDDCITSLELKEMGRNRIS